jgi:hypothetical protein
MAPVLQQIQEDFNNVPAGTFINVPIGTFLSELLLPA